MSTRNGEFSSDIFELSDQVTDQLSELDPLGAVFAGIPGHAHRWPDFSPDGSAAKAEFWANVGAAAHKCEATSRRELVAKRVLEEECRTGGPGTETGSSYGSLNNIVSPWQLIRGSFEQVPVETSEDWANVVARLEGVAPALAGYQQSLEHELQTGTPASVRQTSAAITQAKEAQDHSSLDALTDKLASADLDAAPLMDGLRAAVAGAKEAYAEMTRWLETTYLPQARQEDAVGRDGYLNAAQTFLGTVIDPIQTYEWGWSEFHRIRALLADAAGEMEAGASPERALHLLRTEPERAANSLEEFIEVMADRQHTALRLLQGEHFEVPEEIRKIDVKVDPPGGALAAHYTPPSEDFSRPGTVWYPVSGRDFFPLYEEVTTAYHEGFPGHHLQVGWQVAMGDELSRLHKLRVWYPGSGEGWALYAEHLMGELGFLERPDYRIGLLTSQLFRTCRIVVDIGCHLGLEIPQDSPFHPGEVWNYDLGKAMLETHAFAEPEMAESEIVRYLGWPGQAISYKYGERFILELREEFDRAGVSRKDFHKELLSVGSIGLDLTGELVKPQAA